MEVLIDGKGGNSSAGGEIACSESNLYLRQVWVLFLDLMESQTSIGQCW